MNIWRKRFNRLIAHLSYFEKRYEEMAKGYQKGSWNHALYQSKASDFSHAKTLALDYRDDKPYLEEINLYKKPALQKLIEEVEENAREENNNEDNPGTGKRGKKRNFFNKES